MDPQFILYNREGCHLCEDMIEQLQPYCEKYSFEIQIIDVDRNTETVQKYGLSVPVLCYQKGDVTEEICQYFLDPVALLSFIH
jgi:hypothetical protein